MCSRPRCCRYNRVSHCIFDLDGLLLDTEDIYAKACQRVLDEHGKVLSDETKIRSRGMHTQELAELIVRTYDLPLTCEEYLDQQNTYTMELICNPQFLPGAVRLIQHLEKNKIAMAVATMSDQVSFETKTRSYPEIFSLFKHIVCGSSDEEVKEGKPAPDIFLITASRFCDRPCPERVLVFEDSPNGVWAANAAKMQVVMVPCEKLPCIFQQDATVVLNSLMDFQPEDFGLPPFGN